MKLDLTIDCSTPSKMNQGIEKCEDILRKLRRPEIIERPSLENEKKGDVIIGNKVMWYSNMVPEEEVLWYSNMVPEEEVFFFGRRRNPGSIREKGWCKIDSIKLVRDNGITIVIESSEVYPIYALKCPFYNDKGEEDSFYYIYQPYAKEKYSRFLYTRKDDRPSRYIIGLFELQKYIIEHKRKVKNVVVCKDINQYFELMGKESYPICFLSETFELKEEEIKELYKLCNHIYGL